MSETNWFFLDNGVRVGPVPHRDLCALFSAGRLGLQTKLWCAQFKHWTLASEIRGFRALARRAPPPLPPAPPFGSVVALQQQLPPLPAGPESPEAFPFASPVAAPQPVFIAGLGTFAGDTAAAPASVAARIYPPSPSSAAGPPLMTPHPDPGDLAGPVTVDAEGYPLADPSQARPWVRFFARTIDAILWGTVIIVMMGLLRIDNAVFKWAMLCAWFPIEAVLLSSWGTTMGKSLLGVIVRNADGTPLSFGAALSRALAVWIKGQGLNIPILNLIMHCISYNQLKTFGVTSWDEEAGLKVRHEPLAAPRIATAIVMVLLAMGIGFGVSLARAIEHQRAEQLRAHMQMSRWAGAND